MPAVGLAACTERVALRDAPIEGASPELNAQLRAELVAFEAAIGSGRIVLRGVELRDSVTGDASVVGGYRNERIILTLNDPGPTSILRHELCHAVHLQEGLLRDPDPLFDLAAAGLFTGEEVYAEALDTGIYQSKRRQRYEAMASFCELGPTALAALLDPCPGEPPLVSELATWMFDHVYTEFEPPPAAVPGPVVTLEGWLPGALTQVSGSTAPDLLVVDSTAGSSTWDIATGSRRDIGGARPVPTADTPPVLRGVMTLEQVGFPEGPGAVRGSMWLHQFGASVTRLFVVTEPAPACPDGCWAVVEDSCGSRDDEQLFTAGGAVFRAWTDGLAVHWQEL